ncbi:MAG: NAD(P)-binding protein [Planctomycetes bacterium]|nr:NAD(P)-binding protein [Planctomycetota bacterium]
MSEHCTLRIDGREVTVPAGSTVLEAAGRLGIRIPTLCHRPGCRPLESCFVCAVQVVGQTRCVPSCAMPVQDGMEVITGSPEAAAARRTAVELLLSDHLGECLAPCELACPATWDIPGFMAAAAAGDVGRAAAIARAGLVLPTVLGYLCPAGCQKACRRGRRDEPVTIRDLHRFIGAAGGEAWELSDELAGRRVAVVGAGPAGLAAAVQFWRQGAACTLFDRRGALGGSLLEEDPAGLPREALAADTAAIEVLARAAGGTIELGTPVDNVPALREHFEAVILAVGDASPVADAPGVFPAGACRGKTGTAVRVIADGLAAARAAADYLRTGRVQAEPAPVNVRYGPLTDEEQAIVESRGSAAAAGPVASVAGARRQAGRCLLCGCREHDRCRLRAVAAEVGAKPDRYTGRRRPLQRDDSHPTVAYEPHKCILCGACVAHGGTARLSIVGRGFTARIAGPYEAPMAEALGADAEAIADLCPTSAFHRRLPRPRMAYDAIRGLLLRLLHVLGGHHAVLPDVPRCPRIRQAAGRTAAGRLRAGGRDRRHRHRPPGRPLGPPAGGAAGGGGGVHGGAGAP